MEIKNTSSMMGRYCTDNLNKAMKWVRIVLGEMECIVHCTYMYYSLSHVHVHTCTVV